MCEHVWAVSDREPMKCFAQRAKRRCETCGLEEKCYREIYHVGVGEWQRLEDETDRWIDTLKSF